VDSGQQGDEDRYAAQRERLVRAIKDYADGIGEPPDPRILAAIGSVPRHLLVPFAYRAEAYNDYPLPIGLGQTISQPSLVALMTHLLRPDEDDVVLEVGTGSGYQAAILSKLVDMVYTIEIVEPLAQSARQALQELGASNVHVRHGDGYLGWPEHGPFDGIIVTAGAEDVPAPLLEQLKPGGRMIIPVGPRNKVQTLRLIIKRENGEISEEAISWVRFVPLTREPQADAQ
jgi:protein-L-isoaspartate(D-aspartate) O-methyltransferase